MEVKDPSFPDPSLAKVVKDSTLTILFQFRSISCIICEEGRNCWRISAEKGTLSNQGGFDLASGSEILKRSELGLCLAHLERLFLALLGVSSTHIYLLSELGEFPKGGRTGGLRSSDLWSVLSSTARETSHMS
jgi:hypothetical protein